MTDNPPPPFQILNLHAVVPLGHAVEIPRAPGEVPPADALVFAFYVIYCALSIDPELPVDQISKAVQYRAGTGLARKIPIGILRSDPPEPE